ncbi:MAG: hypothetical protein V4476_28740 [Pseudomonadota bacterium]
MKTLRFGATYGAPPFFDSSMENMGYVEVAAIDLPPQLVEEINLWDSQFQATFCDDYPPDSGFDSVEKLNLHNSHGAELAASIQRNVGAEVTILFIPLKSLKT